MQMLHRFPGKIKNLLILLAVTLYLSPAQAQVVGLEKFLDSLCTVGNFPGLSVAYIKGDGEVQSYVSGFNDVEKNMVLKVTDRFMQGSVGKTYVATIALRYVADKKLNLDDPVSKYLGKYDWFSRLPNAKDITIKMLMNHTSGIMRYEFKETFTRDLSANPDKVWTPAELLSYVLDEQAPFKAGEGWDYSDTNYIILGMVLESISGKAYNDLLQEQLLTPLKLTNTAPTDHKKLDKLVQGYAGQDNPFGGKDKMVNDMGEFIFNPQFEWTGGGVYSTPSDLAKWGKLLYSGNVLSSEMLELMKVGVPAKLGPNSEYGLGVIIRPTPFGKAYGHSGFFPGYLTEMIYFPDHDLCIVVQTNTSDFKRLKFGPARVVFGVAKLITAP